MQMSKNVNNDISMNPPIKKFFVTAAKATKQKMCYPLQLFSVEMDCNCRPVFNLLDIFS